MLGRSFQDDPLWRYFIPDPERRRRLLRGLLAIRVRQGLADGEVYATSSAFEGVAVWLPSAKSDITFGQLIRYGAVSIPVRLGVISLRRIIAAGTFMSGVRRRYAPTCYCLLSPIGVDPDFRGKGYASRLLRPMLARLDRMGLPCYLETQNERNAAMYTHFGFKTLEKVAIPGSGVEHWSMVHYGPDSQGRSR